MKDFVAFQNQYELPPVHDYTFLGTEQSVEKPQVSFEGTISGWFDPTEHVPWVQAAIEGEHFDLELVDGYLPAVKYTYRNPESSETCEMTAFAADRRPARAVHVYVRLVEKADGKRSGVRCFQLREQAAISEDHFARELQKLRDRWTEFFNQGASITCHDPTVLNACKASIVRALITFTGKHPHYGVGRYARKCHDGFPPTIISLVQCLLDWGQGETARDYLISYFERFITTTGRIDYYGPSLAEYGQMLALVSRLVHATGDGEWFEAIRPKVQQMHDWLWAEQMSAENGLMAGVPEADTRDQVDIYFHNNAWCWRGLRDIAGVLDPPDDEDRCNSYRKAILDAIQDVTDRTCEPAFIPPVAHSIEPFTTMTQDRFASYTNYRYWPELLSSGILSQEQMEDIISYRVTHDGEAGGMTRFRQWVDNWPIAEYAAALLAVGKTDEFRQLLFSHLAGHQTPQTWTAYEQVTLDGDSYRKHKGDYCVPVQLVAPRLVAWLHRADSAR